MVNSYDRENNAEIVVNSLNTSNILSGSTLNSGSIQVEQSDSVGKTTLSGDCVLQTGALKTVTETNKTTLPASYNIGDKYLEVILSDTKNVRILVNVTELKNQNYIPGNGIQIVDNVISITSDVALKTDITDFITLEDISDKANVSLNNLSSEGRAKIAIKQYSITETFAQNDFVASIVDGELVIYKSLVDNNIGNALSNTACWEKVEMGGGGTSRNIGEIVASTLPLTDAGLHLLDGALIDGNGIYSDFVDYISNLDLTANYFCTEAEWQQSIADYGVCGKFVYDSVNNTVRLPKITGITEGTTDVTALGDLVEAGLPNITGTMTASGWKLGRPALTGAFYREDTGGDRPSYGSSGGSDWYFDASRSNPIYGNSTTVQPQTIKAFYYIVIATATKTNIQVDIDEIATDLNGKADVDGSNMVNSVKKFDGEWVGSESVLSTATAAGTYTIDLSSYLPNDSYNYEVIILYKAYSTASSDYVFSFYNDIIPEQDNWGYVNTNSRAQTFTINLPVSNQRYITFRATGVTANNSSIIALAYRRIGTNQ